MKKERSVLVFSIGCLISAASLQAQTSKDSAHVAKSFAINEVVVTGTRSETDVRHLPMTVSVVGRPQLEASQQASVLPVLNSQVPGFFSTSRGVMGYGVATGGSGQMSLRGIGGPAQAGLPTTGLLVLIDGHPQYMGLMGHPIADAYQTMMAERVEVLRGPASVLYGSNAMGGVINIVTRKMQEDGIRTNINIGAGSYGTLQTEATNRIRKGRFSRNLGMYLVIFLFIIGMILVNKNFSSSTPQTTDYVYSDMISQINGDKVESITLQRDADVSDSGTAVVNLKDGKSYKVTISSVSSFVDTVNPAVEKGLKLTTQAPSKAGKYVFYYCNYCLV